MIHTCTDIVTVGTECFSVANSVEARFHFVAHGLSSRECFFGPRVFRALHGMHPHATRQKFLSPVVFCALAPISVRKFRVGDRGCDLR